MSRSALKGVMVALLTGASLAGCTQSTTPSASHSMNAPIRVVASTNVWGSVAIALGGSLVSVTSIINDPNQDPHEYAASARNQLELSQARVVIENGGGYDDFVDTMLDAAKNPSVIKLNAVKLSGHGHDSDLNEHVWYDFVGVKKTAAKIAAVFASVDATHAATFAANARTFDSELDRLIHTEAALKSSYAGEGAAITEPVPVYMLDAIGLVDKTPMAFSKAIEDGTDASPAVLKAAIDVFPGKKVKLLAYNEQATGPETEAVLAAARNNGIPVVPIRETLPAKKSYLTWMAENLANIAAALER